MRSMNAGRRFFDTNVLLYLHSSADRRKQTIARQIFQECRDTGVIVLSTQVVQEFYVVGLRKLLISPEILRRLTVDLLDLFVEPIEPAHILQAIWNRENYQISFWDALILAAAGAAGASILYTEDLNHGQLYGQVRVENPFR
jgi:predicted nucleic acid-binding protein